MSNIVKQYLPLLDIVVLTNVMYTILKECLERVRGESKKNGRAFPTL